MVNGCRIVLYHMTFPPKALIPVRTVTGIIHLNHYLKIHYFRKISRVFLELMDFFCYSRLIEG